MDNISITKKDVIWNYVAKLFQIGTGCITLPLVLHFLSPEEIGMNYLMLTISSIVALLDFGFGPQFGRNFTYVNSGAKHLQKEGVEKGTDETINYHLLSVLLKTARYVYIRLSVISLLLMLTLGTVYIYYVTKGFLNVSNSLEIWILFSISVYFNVYYSYYNSLLTGSGMINEAAKATMLSKLIYMCVCILLLFCKFGLFSIVLANLISPFVQRYYSYHQYFTKELLSHLDVWIDRDEVKQTFNVIWYNAKKLGVNFIGSYAINKFGMFLVGLYLPLSTVGSYGLLIQLATILNSIAYTLFLTYEPKFSNYRVTKQKIEFNKLLSFTSFFYLVVMIAGGLVICIFARPLLELIGSKTEIPTISVCILYLIVITLEGNHSLFATVIVTNNEVPFVAAALISGSLVILTTFLILQFTNCGLIGVVLCQGIVQLCYNNWRWPYWVMKENHISIFEYFNFALSTIHQKIIKNIFNGKY